MSFKVGDEVVSYCPTLVGRFKGRIGIVIKSDLPEHIVRISYELLTSHGTKKTYTQDSFIKHTHYVTKLLKELF